MPGHPIPETVVEKAKENYDKLENLILSHDVIFLLTDSREARWLGTCLGALHNKMVLNSALGFDSYLVMRHGHRDLDEISSKEDLGDEKSEKSESESAQKPLSCYFCSDVIAPTDSLKDRTLDQQCTVTRPGVSFMASAMVVELMVSLLHHPQGIKAPADPEGKNLSDNPLGSIPHQIRGFLSTFGNLLIDGPAYDKCTACSTPVLKGLKEEGFAFVQKVCNNPNFLEDLTGLSALKNETVNISIDWDSDEDI